MTRFAKLNARFLAGGRISFAEFEKVLSAYGFRLVRTSGSHRIYVRDGITEQPVIQPDGKNAKAYQLRQFRRTIQTWKLEPDDAP